MKPKKRYFHLISCSIRTWNLFSDPKRKQIEGWGRTQRRRRRLDVLQQRYGGYQTPRITVFLQKLTRPLLSVSSPPPHTPCVRHHVHISMPLVPILSHMHWVYARLHLFRNHFNIISLLLLDLSSGLFPSGFITDALDAVLLYACNMPWPSHPQFFTCLLSPCVFFSTLCSNTMNPVIHYECKRVAKLQLCIYWHQSFRARVSR